jgi:hypothetical protein
MARLSSDRHGAGPDAEKQAFGANEMANAAKDISAFGEHRAIISLHEGSDSSVLGAGPRERKQRQ